MKNIKIKISFIIIILLICIFSANYIFNGINKKTQIQKKKVTDILTNSKFYYADDIKNKEYIETLVKERKDLIFNSKSEIKKSNKFIAGETYTGTAYYISYNGADFNNGLTPETPIKSIKTLNKINLKKGDAVFFERGGIYRTPEEPLRVRSYITYSAYGEGTKPVITRIGENAAKEENWEIYYKGKNGKTIWKYKKQIGDVGAIVLDNKIYATRVVEWPTPTGWLLTEFKKVEPHNGIRAKDDATTAYEITSTNKYLNVEDNLTEDLTYISRVNIENLKYPYNTFDKNSIGYLYLRCDKGNPGKHFDDIEIITIIENQKYCVDGRLIDSWDAENYIIDNLSLKYFVLNAISADIVKSNNVLVQNSTIEWGGNILYKLETETPTNNYMFIGDGIYQLAKNAKFKNNYFSQIGNAITFEEFNKQNVKLGTLSITNNLIENCGQGIRLGLQNKKRENTFKKIEIKDNFILNTGKSMSNACLEMPAAIDLSSSQIQYSEIFDITNNTMVNSTMALMRIPPTSKVKMNINNNVFIQDKNGILLTEMEWNKNGVNWYLMKDTKSN